MNVPPSGESVDQFPQSAAQLRAAGRQADLERLLTDATYLQGRLVRSGTAAVVADLALMPDCAPIQRLSDAVRAGAVVLEQKPDELLNQIQGRVGGVSLLQHLAEPTAPSFRLRSRSLVPADPALVRTFIGHTRVAGVPRPLEAQVSP